MFDWAFAVEILPVLLVAARITVFVTLASFGLSLVGGLLLLGLRRSRIGIIANVTRFLIDVIRGTPLLMQVFLIYFIAPQYGFRLSPIQTGILAFSLHYSCYMAEAYRATLEAIPHGQWEAAQTLGLPRLLTFFKVILPQMIPNVLPTAGSYLVYMFKDTPILSAITVRELLQVATKISAEQFRYMEPITIAGLLFLVMSMLASFLIRRVEYRLRAKA